MKKVLFFVVLIASILVINNLIHSIYGLWQKRDLVTLAQKELIRQKQENQRLKSQLSYVKSKEFVEQEARNKLFWVKPGEQQVLMSQDLVKESTPSAQANKDPNWDRKSVV